MLEKGLLDLKFPKELENPFALAIFELGLKHSSPKVLIPLLPTSNIELSTEHIKSHLQKYRIHNKRSREEFEIFYRTHLLEPFHQWEKTRGWEMIPGMKPQQQQQQAIEQQQQPLHTVSSSGSLSSSTREFNQNLLQQQNSYTISLSPTEQNDEETEDDQEIRGKEIGKSHDNDREREEGVVSLTHFSNSFTPQNKLESAFSSPLQVNNSNNNNDTINIKSEKFQVKDEFNHHNLMDLPDQQYKENTNQFHQYDEEAYLIEEQRRKIRRLQSLKDKLYGTIHQLEEIKSVGKMAADDCSRFSKNLHSMINL